jgi:hypothetical protein
MISYVGIIKSKNNPRRSSRFHEQSGSSIQKHAQQVSQSKSKPARPAKTSLPSRHSLHRGCALIVRIAFRTMYTHIDDIPPGYPSVAALFSKDNDFAIFRKFRYLNTRNILYLQAELISLESKLEELDRTLLAGARMDALKSWEAFSKDEDRQGLALSIRKHCTSTVRILRLVRRLLTDADAALLQFDTVANLQSPSRGSIGELDRWMRGTQHVNDGSKDFLQSGNPEGNVRLKPFLRRVVSLWKGKSTDNSELTTISRHADSSLTGLIKWSPLRYLFLVRVEAGEVYHC